MRDLFRNDRRPGLWLGGFRRHLEGDRPRPAGGPFRGSANLAMIRIVLPAHLRTLAGVNDEVQIHVEGAVTQRSVLDALEARYPTLRGTVRDQQTQKRRPLVRFFACAEDLSHDSPDLPLPDPVVKGNEPFCIVGAMAGG